MSRDYVGEMRALIDQETGTGPYVSRQVAAQIMEKLAATDPDLLDGWLHAQAETILWQAINDRDRSLRAHARATSGRSVFAANAEAHEAGDTAALSRWLATPFAVADGYRKRLGDMDKHDLRFAAEAYEVRAEQNRLTASFLIALARKVRRGTVADHYTEDQLAAMWNSLSGGSA